MPITIEGTVNILTAVLIDHDGGCKRVGRKCMQACKTNIVKVKLLCIYVKPHNGLKKQGGNDNYKILGLD